MKRQILLGTTVAVALVWGSAATLAAAGDAAGKARYKGDSTARAVCMSIVRDDVSALDRALNQKSNYYDARNIHLSYRCNAMALNEFAFNQSAVEVAQYLAPMFREGTVTIEQVSSIDE
jgi:hypothetical protein